MEKIEKNGPLGRKLHWNILNKAKIKGTIFNEIQSDIDKNKSLIQFINVDHVTELFKKPEKDICTHERKTAKLSFLKPVRAQNVGIVFSRLELPLNEILIHIDKLDKNNLLNIDILQKIKDILPNKVEVELFESFMRNQGNINELNDIEKKMIPILKMQSIQDKCKILFIKYNFEDKLEIVEHILQTFNNAAKEIRNSEKFRLFLTAILVWGNFVNHGVDIKLTEALTSQSNELTQNSNIFNSTRRKTTGAIRVCTYGFTLASLHKLNDFKTVIDPSITSLHFIIANMIHSYPELNLHLLYKELESIPKAAKIEFSSVHDIISDLENDLLFLKSQINTELVSTMSESMIYVCKMYDNYNNKLLSIKVNKENIFKYITETSLYFANGMEKNTTDNYEDLFKTLNLFLEKYMACVSDYLKTPQKYKNIIVKGKDNLSLAYFDNSRIDAVGRNKFPAKTLPIIKKKSESISNPQSVPFIKSKEEIFLEYKNIEENDESLSIDDTNDHNSVLASHLTETNIYKVDKKSRKIKYFDQLMLPTEKALDSNNQGFSNINENVETISFKWDTGLSDSGENTFILSDKLSELNNAVNVFSRTISFKNNKDGNSPSENNSIDNFKVNTTQNIYSLNKSEWDISSLHENIKLFDILSPSFNVALDNFIVSEHI